MQYLSCCVWFISLIKVSSDSFMVPQMAVFSSLSMAELIYIYTHIYTYINHILYIHVQIIIHTYIHILKFQSYFSQEKERENLKNPQGITKDPKWPK